MPGCPGEGGAHQEKLDELRCDIDIGIEQADKRKLAPSKAKETLARVKKERQSRKDN
jgi:hypothetical protein